MASSPSQQQPPVWPAFRVVIFDCDSTLSSIEGIDQLARLAGGADDTAVKVAVLTKRAMEGDIPLEAVYGMRLVAVNPTKAQVQQIARAYRDHVIRDARPVIAALRSAGVEVFIVSGGLTEPVQDFGEWLGIPPDHIFAVRAEFNELAGQWWRYWEQPGGQNPSANYRSTPPNPLTGSQGKNIIIAGLRKAHPGRALLVGDGLSDLEASPEVDLFAGFGGAVYRPRIAEEAPVYLSTPSLAAILPLALGRSIHLAETAALWSEGLRQLYQGDVRFSDPAIADAFWRGLGMTPPPD